MSYFLRILLVIVCAGAFGVAAQASVFVWQDPATGASISFPDRWGMVQNLKPDDAVTVQAPGAEDAATCRLRIRHDGRFGVYPAHFDRNIQRLYFSDLFWNNYVQEFDGTLIHHVRDNAGLGRGYASRADLTYVDQRSGALKRAVAFASMQKDKVYIVECSAAVDVYDRYFPVFMSVMKSVDTRPRAVRVTNGYRDFLGDNELRIHGARPYDHYKY